MDQKMLSSLVFLLFPTLLFSQYSEGTIELVTGEQLTGFIRKDGDSELQKEIYFKNSPGDNPAQVYYPKDARAFEIAGYAAFHAIPVSREENGILIKELEFAKLLARGPVDLYFVQTSVLQNTFVFYARKDDRLHLLSKEQVLLSSGNYTQKDSYKGVLTTLTFDCREQLGDMSGLRFTRKEILTLINAYNSCKDGGYVPLTANTYQEPKERRYFAEIFTGPIIGKTGGGVIGSRNPGDKKLYFGMLGAGLQLESFRPSFSNKLIVNLGLGAYKWFNISEVSEEEYAVPDFTITGNLSGQYLLSPYEARLQWFTRLSAIFNFTFTEESPFTPGIAFGFGTYLPSGSRLGLQYETLSIFGGGISQWRLGFAFLLGEVKRS